MSACDRRRPGAGERDRDNDGGSPLSLRSKALHILPTASVRGLPRQRIPASRGQIRALHRLILRLPSGFRTRGYASGNWPIRSEEHTSELQSLMRISYAVFCLKKKKQKSAPYTGKQK